jgi:hypothetical protein
MIGKKKDGNEEDYFGKKGRLRMSLFPRLSVRRESLNPNPSRRS